MRKLVEEGEKKKREIFLGAFFVDLSEKWRIELNSTEFK